MSLPCLTSRPITRALIIAVLTAQCVWLTGVSAETRDILISIRGIRLDPGEEVGGLTLETANLRLLALCRVPPEWALEIDAPPEPFASLHGGNIGAIGTLRPENLDELDPLLLARTKLKELPTSIAGTVIVETKGADPGSDDRPRLIERILRPENIVMEPADACPPQSKWDRHSKRRSSSRGVRP